MGVNCMMQVEERLGAVGTRRRIGVNERQVVTQDEVVAPRLDPGEAI